MKDAVKAQAQGGSTTAETRSTRTSTTTPGIHLPRRTECTFTAETVTECHQVFNNSTDRAPDLEPKRPSVPSPHPQGPGTRQRPYLDVRPARQRASLRVGPYQDEWEHLMEAIRNDKPFNELERGETGVVTSMGRIAAHTGIRLPMTRCSSAITSSLWVENLTLNPNPTTPRLTAPTPSPNPARTKTASTRPFEEQDSLCSQEFNWSGE